MIKIYKIELATKNDLENIRKVFWNAFEKPYPFEKFELGPWFEEENHYRSLVIRDGQNIVSHLGIRSYEAFIRGVYLPIGGIGDVATEPLYRNRGMVRELTKHAFKVMKQHGEVFSTLHPFEMAFYEKFGYATAEIIDRYQISATNFREIPLPPGVTIRELSDPKDAEILDTLQRTMIRFGSMVFFRRSELEDLISSPDCYLFEKNGEPIGWVKFFLHKVDFLRQKLVTNFYAFKNNEAFQAIVYLMRIFAQQYDLTTEFHDTGLPCMWEGLPNIPIPETVKNRFALKVQQVGGFMLRIVDFQGYCQQIKIPITANEPVILELKDKMCEWNNGIWKLQPNKGKLTITKVTNKPDIIVDDLTLSRIVGGLAPATTLLTVGSIHCSLETANNLEAIFPREYFYVWNRDL
ncbi:MAG: enhanced intracellular survival protein Eis [Candidatus Thorarchaeota archaeon]